MIVPIKIQRKHLPEILRLFVCDKSVKSNLENFKMLSLKKFYREELLQLALLLSLLRVDPNSYLGIDIQTIGVGSLDLNNGSGWHLDAHTIVHRPVFVHPKNLDSMLLNYERDIFEDLNSLGRYNRLNSAPNDIHAYLLNVEDSGTDSAVPGPSIPNSTDLARNITTPDPPTSLQSPSQPDGAAELTQEVFTNMCFKN